MNSSKALVIFVEGEYDVRFFDRIVQPYLKKRYESIRCIEYAQREPSETRKKLSAFDKIAYYDLWFVADLDQHGLVQEKIKKIKNTYGKHATPIIIVKSEIECWYFAGIPAEVLTANQIPFHSDTEQLDKEQIANLVPNFTTRVEFYEFCLEHFSLHTTMRHNQSFKYFAEQYLPLS